MFSSPVMNTRNDVTSLTKEEELGLKEKKRLHDMCGIDDEFKDDFLNSYFETLNVSNEQEDDWNLMILKTLEFREFADCKALINMLDDQEYVFKYKFDLQRKLEEMIHWFLYEYMGITSRPVPPYFPDQRKIDLLSLYILVAKDGGYREVTTENIWPIIAKNLGFEYKDGDYMRITYAMYLDVLEYYYKFKSVQEAVHVKEMVNDGAELTGGRHRKTRSEGTSQNENADNVHNGADSTQFALFTGNGWESNWNLHKRRKRFNFSYMKKAMEDANRSVMQQDSNITNV
ncbi:putative transcription factor & chromatin remodeling ARID family [Helianthus debilis subsp. tardiflorus]